MLALGAVAVLWWFVPAVTNANQPAPVHVEVGFHSACVEESMTAPDYGSRESASNCEQIQR